MGKHLKTPKNTVYVVGKVVSQTQPRSTGKIQGEYCKDGLRYMVCVDLDNNIVEYIDMGHTGTKFRVIVRMRKTPDEVVELVKVLKKIRDIDAYVEGKLLWLEKCRWDRLLCPNVEFPSY